MVAIYIVAIVNDNVIVFVDSGDKVRSSLPLVLVEGGRGDIGDLTRQVICCSWTLYI